MYCGRRNLRIFFTSRGTKRLHSVHGMQVLQQEVLESAVAILENFDKTYVDGSTRRINNSDVVRRIEPPFPPPVCGTCITWPYQMVIELTTSPKLGTGGLRRWSATITRQYGKPLRFWVMTQQQQRRRSFATPAEEWAAACPSQRKRLR